MDIFDQGEQALAQGANVPGVEVQRNTGATSVAELPQVTPEEQRAATNYPQPKTFITNDGIRRGGDVFDQGEALQQTHEAAARGEDLTPYMKRLSDLGVNDDAGVDAANRADRGIVDALNHFNRTTSVGGEHWADGKDLAHEVDYQQWLKLRHDFQVNNPSSPLPPTLQVWQLGLADDATKKAAWNTNDRPLLHDEGLQQEARKRFGQSNPGEALPDGIQGTEELKQRAAQAMQVKVLRQTLGPAAAGMTDDQVYQFHNDQLEHEGQALVIRAVRGVLGDSSAHASDADVLTLAKRNPEIFQEALAKVMLPQLAQAAQQRETQRAMSGALANDTPEGVESDKRMIAGWRQQIATGQASARLFPGAPSLGDLMHFLNAADLGLPGLMAHGDQQSGQAWDDLYNGYKAGHPAAALISETAGYLTPGSPSYFLGKGLGKVVGTPLRAGVAGLAGEETIGGAVNRLGQPVEAAAFNRAGPLARFAGNTAAAAVEQPVFGAASNLVQGKPAEALQALDYSRPENREGFADMAAGGAILHGAQSLVMNKLAPAANWWWRGGRDIDQRLGDMGIELTAEDHSSILRVLRAKQLYEAGHGDAFQSLEKAGAGVADLQRFNDIWERVKAAQSQQRTTAEPEPQKQAAQTAAGEEAAGDKNPPAPPPGNEAPAAAEAPKPEPKAEPGRAGGFEPGKELLGPRDAAIARTRALLDEFAPRQPDGTRRFTGAWWNELADRTSEARGVVDQLLGRKAAELPELKKRAAIVGLAERLDEMYGGRPTAADEQAGRGTDFEDRKLPPAPDSLGEPAWKPKLSSMTAAKASAAAAGVTGEGVKLGKTQFVPTAHVVDELREPVDPAAVEKMRQKLAPGENSQADAVPPPVVRRMRNGGYQVLSGREQFHAAKGLHHRQIPVIVAEGAARPAGSGPAPKPPAGPGTGYPRRLESAKDVGAWYGKQFKDKPGADAIEALASMHEGPFVLADVPSEKIDPSVLMEGDADASKVEALSKLTAEQRAALPPAVLVGHVLDEKLHVADGAHRTLAAQKTGAATVRGYVPESWIGKAGVREVGGTPEPEPGEGLGGSAPHELTKRQFLKAAPRERGESMKLRAKGSELIPALRINGVTYSSRAAQTHANVLPPDDLFRLDPDGDRVIPGYVRPDSDEFIYQLPEVAHKKEVEAALRDGKEVPENVLADYPGLARRLEEQAAPAAEPPPKEAPAGTERPQSPAAPLPPETKKTEVEKLPDVPAAAGRATTIETADVGHPVPARYAVMELADLIPSHNPLTFKPDPKYPPNVQERDYQHNKEEQAKVNNNAHAFNPAFLLSDTPSPADGPPMVLPDGRVMGGNSRAMVAYQHYRLGEKRAGTFRGLTVEAAERFGVPRADAEKMKEPVLVRRLEERPADAARMRQLVRLLQKGRTMEMDASSDAASRARILLDHPDTLERLDEILGDGDTVREALSSVQKTSKVRAWLTNSQVFTNTEVARLTNHDTGMFNEAGKDLIEKILRSVIVSDPGLFDGVPANVAGKITGNLAPLLLPKLKGPEWDVSADVEKALAGYHRWRAGGMDLDDFLNGNMQQTIVPDPLLDPDNRRANVILRRLVTDNVYGFRERAKAYAGYARDVMKGQGGFGFAQDSQPDPARDFKRVWEADVPPGAKAAGGGALFGPAPEKYLNDLQDLRRLFSDPDAMTAGLRRALRMPRRMREGGIVFMATGVGGGQPIDPAELLKVPEVAEKIARIATFHLEQHADAGDKLQQRWAEAVESDLGGILKDLGYQIAAGKFTELLSKVWDGLREDEDVKGALGELPKFDPKEAGRGRRKPDAAGGRRGGLDRERGRDAAGGSEQPGSPQLPGDQGGDGADVVPPPAAGEPEEGVPVEPDAGGEVPQWVPRDQRDDYLAALGSDRLAPYAPLPPARRGHSHPRLLVESKALAGVPAGGLRGYEPDPRAVASLSDPQRDQVARIGYRIHFTNAGALTADDVGVGKSRIIGGVVADQMLRHLGGLSGKRNVLVLTKNRQNIGDLRTTFTDEMKDVYGPLLDRGLQIRSVPDMDAATAQTIGRGGGLNLSLLDAFNLAKYGEAMVDAAPDLVLIDEAHLFGNLEGDTQRANVLERLHVELLPRGTHFAYFTATPASDIAALKFMYGLRQWAPAKLAERDPDAVDFDGWLHRATGISKAGSWRESIATPVIEQLMRELKMDNAYASRDFWRGGFEFNMLPAKVRTEQLEQYDAAANLLRDAITLYAQARPRVNHPKWPASKDVGKAPDRVAPDAAGELKSPPRPDGQAIFFMKRLLVQYRMDTAIAEARAALARGDQVVFKILGVSDTHLHGDGGNLGAVLNSIPTWAAAFDKGKLSHWDKLHDAAAGVESLRARARKLAAMGSAPSPLDQVLAEFGDKNVAAIVGPTPAKARIEQNAEFQAGKRRVAIISSAGTTGINLQDRGTGRRHMIVLDLDWDSKEFKQTLGRIDRTGQLSTPGATTIYTPIAGERKFQSTIAARMKSQGAISKGQSDAGNTDALNDFDMEGSTWHRAINETVRALDAGTRQKMIRGQALGDAAGEEINWRDFQNDLMLLPHQLGNEIFEKAEARWRELEEENRRDTGDKVGRRNRGMIRSSTPLDESEQYPLALHQVENVTGETYGILAGKLLTRPKEQVALKTITDAIGAKTGVARARFVTMQQGERVVSGLFVPRGKIEAVKAVFGRASQRELYGPGAGGAAGKVPQSVIEQLPPKLAMLASVPQVPPAVMSFFHRDKPGLVSRQDLSDFVIRKLGVAVAQGKQNIFRPRKGGRVLGYYNSGQTLIRQHVVNSIGTLAHEVGHRLDDLFTDLSPTGQFDHELLPLGGATSRASYTLLMRRREGVAEWFRHYMIDPALARLAAPGYTAWFEKRMADFPGVAEAVTELQGLFQEYLAQDPVEQFQSQIAWSEREGTFRSPLHEESTLGYLYRHTFDRFAPLDWMRRELTSQSEWDTPKRLLKTAGKKPYYLPDRTSDDAYSLARLNAGNRDMVRGWVKYGVRDRRGKLVAPALDQVLRENGIRDGRTRRNFETYLMARRAMELYNQEAAGLRKLRDVIDDYGGKLGFTKQQAWTVYNKFHSPAFEQAAKGVYAFNTAFLDHFVRTSGAFSDDQIDAILKLNQNYVPFHVVMDEVGAHAGGAGSSKLADRNPRFHRVMGSGRQKLPPLATMVRNMVKMVESVEANRAALKALELIRRNPRGGFYADKIARPIAATTGQLEEIKKYLVAAGMDPDLMKGQNGNPPEIDPEALFTIFRPVRHNPAAGEIAVKEGGKTKVWQVHTQALYDALTGTYATPTNNLLLRALALTTGMIRRGFIDTPDFMMGHAIRGVQLSTVLSRNDWKPLHLNPLKKDFGKSDLFVGLAHMLGQTETYQLFLHAKGGQSHKQAIVTDELEHTVADLGKMPSAKWLKNTLTPGGWLHVLEALATASDNATRVGEFARALKREGVNAEGLARAALAARDVRLDFSRSGQWVQELGRYRAFVNAAFQGADSTARAFKDRPVASLIRSMLGLMLPALLIHYLCRENPDYQERAEERKLYLLIPRGNPRTTKNWLRVRKPYELGMVFQNLAESIFESVLAKDPAAMREWIPGKKAAFDMLTDLLPSALVPFIEAGVNYDFFRDRKIVYNDKVAPELQVNRGTSDLAKWLGRHLDLSPAKIDHVVYGLTGTAGTGAERMVERELLGHVIKDGGEARPLEQDLPGVRTLVSHDLSPNSADSLTALWAMIDRLDEAQASLAQVKNDGGRYKELEARYKDVLDRKGDLTVAREQLQLLRRDLNEAYDSQKLSPEDKRARISHLTAQMVNLARGVLRKTPYQE